MPPAFLDEADRARLRAFPHVTLQVVPGAGHALLDEALEPCLEAVRSQIERLGSN
jgi:pimeloyl-ACP methyl ester carboxylesterase